MLKGIQGNKRKKTMKKTTYFVRQARGKGKEKKLWIEIEIKIVSIGQLKMIW